MVDIRSRRRSTNIEDRRASAPDSVERELLKANETNEPNPRFPGITAEGRRRGQRWLRQSAERGWKEAINDTQNAVRTPREELTPEARMRRQIAREQSETARAAKRYDRKKKG